MSVLLETLVLNYYWLKIPKVDAPNQLFNLTADPEELNPIDDMNLENELLDYLNRTLVHPPQE